MEEHYFTKLVNEQQHLGGTSWQRKDNLVVRSMMVGQGKLGTRNGEANLKYKATENFTANIFSIYKNGT